MPSASPVTAMPHGPPAPATFARRTKQPILPAGKLRRFWSLHDVQEREDLRHPDAGADRLSAVPHLLERRIGDHGDPADRRGFLYHRRSEEHTSELQSLMRISYAVFCLKKK